MTKTTPSNSIEASDRQLLRRYRDLDDQTAFAAIVERYQKRVESVARRAGLAAAQAEDCAQETFSLFAQKAASLSSEVILAGWFQRTAFHVSRTHLRSEIRRRTRENASCENSDIPFDSPRVATQIRELSSTIDQAVDELQPPFHDAISLCFLRGLSQRAAATELGCSESALSKRLKKALAQLRKNLSQRGVKVSSATLIAFLVDLNQPSAEGAEETFQITERGFSPPWSLKVAFLSGAAASLFLVFSLGWNRAEDSPQGNQSDNSSEAIPTLETRAGESSPATYSENERVTDLSQIESIFTELFRSMLQRDLRQSWETAKNAGVPIDFDTFVQVRKSTTGEFHPIGFMKAWSDLEPLPTVDWAMSITRESPLFSVIRPPLEKYYSYDPSAAKRYINQIPDTHPLKDEATAWLALRENPFAWAIQIESMRPSPERSLELRSLQVALAAENPAKAADWVQDSSLLETEKLSLLTYILPELGETQPALAIMHMERLSDYADVATALPQMAERIAKSFPKEAPSYYQTFQSPEFYENERYRNSVIRSVGRGLAQASPVDAIDWMHQLPESDQTLALAGILTQIQPPELIAEAVAALRNENNYSGKNDLLHALPELPFEQASRLFDIYLAAEGIEVFGETERKLVETLSGHLSQFSLRGNYEDVSNYLLGKEFDSPGMKGLLLLHPAMIWSFADHPSLLNWFDKNEAKYSEMDQIRESISRLRAKVTLTEGHFDLNFSTRKTEQD